jgi:hypothetical protein
MKRRRVIGAKRKGKHFSMKLECGHVVTKRDRGHKQPPQMTECDECARALERARACAGWFLSSEIGAKPEVLELFKQEGLVEDSRAIRTVHWKARPA